MIVGYMADIPFLTSGVLVRTFDGFTNGGEGRWAKHDIIGDKPVLEFLGPDVEEISFKMLLRSDLGVNPTEEIKRLCEMRDEGTVFPLVIGNRSVGENFWILKSISYEVAFWDKHGQPLSAEVSVSLQEYVEEGLL